jgi:hypothetical protein
MFKRRGPTYTDYGSDAPPQPAASEVLAVMAVAFVASILWAIGLLSR